MLAWPFCWILSLSLSHFLHPSLSAETSSKMEINKRVVYKIVVKYYIFHICCIYQRQIAVFWCRLQRHCAHIVVLFGMRYDLKSMAYLCMKLLNDDHIVCVIGSMRSIFSFTTFRLLTERMLSDEPYSLFLETTIFTQLAVRYIHSNM